MHDIVYIIVDQGKDCQQYNNYYNVWHNKQFQVLAMQTGSGEKTKHDWVIG